jgi:predicted RNA polymerase sigma factor
MIPDGTVVSLVFTEGYVATGGPGLRRDDLAAEAIRLGGSWWSPCPTRPDALAEAGALDAGAPLHAARAGLLRRLGRAGEAAAECALAARLTGNPAERAFLEGRSRA